MKAPGSIARLSCSTSPDIRAVEARNTLLARIMPLMAPCIRTVWARTSPVTEPLTPTISALHLMSPLTTPSTWISPADVRLPSMVRSALTMDGTAFTVTTSAVFSCACSLALLALENITTGLQKLERVNVLSVVDDFVMEMRSRATAAAAHLADFRPPLHQIPLFDQRAREMRVTRDQPHAVINFNHTTITAVKHNMDDSAFAWA